MTKISINERLKGFGLDRDSDYDKKGFHIYIETSREDCEYGSWENPKNQVSPITDEEILKAMDFECESGYGHYHGPSVIVFTKDEILVMHVYDGSSHFVNLPRSPEVLDRDYDDYIPIIGS